MEIRHKSTQEKIQVDERILEASSILFFYCLRDYDIPEPDLRVLKNRVFYKKSIEVNKQQIAHRFVPWAKSRVCYK